MRGNTLVPPALFGRFAILCAILRQLHLILQVGLVTRELDDLAPDAFFVDQLSAGIPLLARLATAPVFFYCHFPDLLLARGRARLWKRLYRLPFDALELWSMHRADAVAVNSAFTRSVVERTWPALAREKTLHVVYPCIDTTTTTTTPSIQQQQQQQQQLPWGLPPDTPLILSINRFERKKDVGLALRAFALIPPHRRARARAKLLIAGGYDPRVPENVAYHEELRALAAELGLRSATIWPSDGNDETAAAAAAARDAQVLFLLNVSGALKARLLAAARLLVYTPRGEHFGIVPLEAMHHGVPVLAADEGGPTETVVDGATGWLRDAGRPRAWCDVMERVLLLHDDDHGDEHDGAKVTRRELRRMGEAGRRRVREKFGQAEMARRLEEILEDAIARTAGRRRPSAVLPWLLILAGLAAALVVLGYLAYTLAAWASGPLGRAAAPYEEQFRAVWDRSAGRHENQLRTYVGRFVGRLPWPLRALLEQIP